MKCMQCGTPNSDSMKFCTKCGAPINVSSLLETSYPGYVSASACRKRRWWHFAIAGVLLVVIVVWLYIANN